MSSLFIILVAYNIIQQVVGKVNATTSNSSGEYYIASSVNDTISRNQIVCENPNCYIICDVDDGCHYTSINASKAHNLTLYCSNTRSCYDLKLIEGPSLNLNINCTEKDYSCYNAYLIANHTTNINIHCKNCLSIYLNAYGHGYFSSNDIYIQHAIFTHIFVESMVEEECEHNYLHINDIYGINTPGSGLIITTSNASCTWIISCPSNQGAMCNIDSILDSVRSVSVKNVSYIDLNCNNSDPTSCEDLNIYCQDNGHSSEIFYNDVSLKWECDDYRCCPIIGSTIRCRQGLVCYMDCTEQLCDNNYIDGTDASGLYVYCDINECQKAIIQCPVNYRYNGDTLCHIQCNDANSCNNTEIIAGGANYLLRLNCLANDSCKSISLNFYRSRDRQVKSISLLCVGDRSCYNLTIDLSADQSESFDLSYFHLICDGSNSCEELTISGVANIDYLYANCSKINSCKSAAITTKLLGKLELHCYANGSCNDMNIYCPYTSNEACLIYCNGISCNQISINVPITYQYGYLDYYCNDSECKDVSIQCRSADEYVDSLLYVLNITTDLEYNFAENEYECSNTSSMECCPFTDNKLVCKDNEFCNMYCSLQNYTDVSNCVGMIIDGSTATRLDLLCTDEDSCSDLIVYCPINGCSIQCAESTACDSMQIMYYGKGTDNGQININCYYDAACSSMIIHAPYIKNLYMICTANCNDISIHSEYGNYINVNCNNSIDDNTKVCNNMNIHGDYSSWIVIDAWGNNAWYNSTIFSSKGDYVDVTCSGDSSEYPSCNGHWFMPMSVENISEYGGRFEVNCYGIAAYRTIMNI